jgi:hypothetical protein
MNPATETVLAALRSKHESIETRADGTSWGLTCLDNARPAGISDLSFRATLAALAKAGLYRVVDGFAWGEVRL